MIDFISWMSWGFASGIIFASFFEWTLHRYVMHRPVGPFTYPYRAHALTHHKIFRADTTYHLVDEKDKWTIPMAWWNGPVLVIISNLPFYFSAWLFGQAGLCVGSLLAIGIYYATYEYLHWCMHLPRQRSIERSGIFFRLNGHHLLHHRYTYTNFNVVLPLADLLLGTLRLRSKFSFAQPRGPMIPDVQPRTSLPKTA